MDYTLDDTKEFELKSQPQSRFVIKLRYETCFEFILFKVIARGLCRPHLEEFLQEMSTLYELHMYTMGTKAYAEEVGKIIDPQSKLFQVTFFNMK